MVEFNVSRKEVIQPIVAMWMGKRMMRDDEWSIDTKQFAW
jgi:hypothetical protein